VIRHLCSTRARMKRNAKLRHILATGTKHVLVPGAGLCEQALGLNHRPQLQSTSTCFLPRPSHVCFCVCWRGCKLHVDTSGRTTTVGLPTRNEHPPQVAAETVDTHSWTETYAPLMLPDQDAHALS
jgi:hypothetical protein